MSVISSGFKAVVLIRDGVIVEFWVVFEIFLKINHLIRYRIWIKTIKH